MKSVLHVLAQAALSLLLVQGASAGQVLKLAKGVVDPVRLAGELKGEEFVVQFQDKITEQNKRALEAAGLKVQRYLPEDALIVRGSASAAALAEKQAGVRVVIPYYAELKKQMGLSPYSVFSANRSELVWVLAFSQKDAEHLEAQLQNDFRYARVVSRDGRILTVQAPQAEIGLLMSLPEVEHVQNAVQVETFDMDLMTDEARTQTAGNGDYTDLQGNEAGTTLLGLEAAWNKGLTGKGQAVSMADTGLDSGVIATLHNDLQGSVKVGFSFGIGASDWSDPMGHGTHVAGSVLGRGTHSGGLLKGSAYDAEMIPEGMWSPIIDNLTVPPKLDVLFSKAQEAGARVHTNSWGSPKNLGVYDAMAAQADDYMWNNQEFLVVFAAGNSGVDLDKNGVIDPGSVSTPGLAKNVLTVGASENVTSVGGIQVPISKLRRASELWGAEPISSSLISDNANGIAMFSSRGPTADGRIKPDVVSPGTNILSLRSQVKGANELWGAYNDKYAWSGGTSMATPLVAGVAAVVRQALAEENIKTPSAALVKGLLMHTAFDLYPGQYGEGSATQELKTVRPNNDEGYGRVDMNKFVSVYKKAQLNDEKTGLGQGETKSYSIKTKAGQKVIATLVWTDAPGTPSAGKMLVNDLNMTVANGGASVEKTDSINNSEHFEEVSSGGTYTVTVSGFNVPMGKNGKQPYALILSAE